MILLYLHGIEQQLNLQIIISQGNYQVYQGTHQECHLLRQCHHVDQDSDH